MDTIKAYLPHILAALIGAWAGFYVGSQYYSTTVTKTVEKPVIVQGETKTQTKTEIAYVPKETVIVKYIDVQTGQEATATAKENTDLEAQIGKTDFNVKLNGQEIQFKKADDERFIFDKNKIALNQSNVITFDAKISPQVIDKTKRWGIGIGYGGNGAAYKIDFPIGKNDTVGGWGYKDGRTKAGGIEIKF